MFVFLYSFYFEFNILDENYIRDIFFTYIFEFQIA